MVSTDTGGDIPLPFDRVAPGHAINDLMVFMCEGNFGFHDGIAMQNTLASSSSRRGT